MPILFLYKLTKTGHLKVEENHCLKYFIINFIMIFSTGHAGVCYHVRSVLAFSLCFLPPSQQLSSFSCSLSLSLLLFPLSVTCIPLSSYFPSLSLPVHFFILFTPLPPFLSSFSLTLHHFLPPPSPPHPLTGKSFAGRHQWC